MAGIPRRSLRTEIVVSTALLVGAALLFITLLLIRLGENDRLAEQVQDNIKQARMLGSALAELDNNPSRARMLHGFVREMELTTWALSDDGAQILAGVLPQEKQFQNHLQRLLRRALLQSEPVIDLQQPQPWLNVVSSSPPTLEIALGVYASHPGRHALYLRFPLKHIRHRTLEQLAFALWICFGYGLVLSLAAVYILQRAVIGPVEELTSVTAALMHGQKEARVSPCGPLEIATLGQSFNQMAMTLEQNQEELQNQLEELRHKNHELSATRLSLMQAARMASVGHLASGMAHEIGNPLSAVMAYLSLARRKDDLDVRNDLLQRAQVEAERIDQIIRDMLDYASAGPADNVASQCPNCAPLQVIHETCNILEHQGVFKQRDFKLNLQDELPECCIPAHHLQQILVNLLLNARDATGAGDSMELSACNHQESVEIAVKDSGKGMTQAQQQAAFDPFFTQGKPGGRGLGLYVCYQQLNECGGDIMLSSTLGQGSCFTVLLRHAHKYGAQTGRDEDLTQRVT